MLLPEIIPKIYNLRFFDHHKFENYILLVRVGRSDRKMKLQITIDRIFRVLTFSHSLYLSNEARNVIPDHSNTEEGKEYFRIN